MAEEAAEWRAKLIEEVASTDEVLMEKFFEDPDSITPRSCSQPSARLRSRCRSFRCSAARRSTTKA